MSRYVALTFLALGVGSLPAPAQDRWAEKLFLKEGTKEIVITHDFGNVPHGAQLYHRFPITNIYAVRLDITDARAGCGCVKVAPSVKSLEPKQTGYIEVSVDTTRFTGPKTVVIQVAVGNSQYNSSCELKVSYNSRQDIVFNPGQVSFAVVNQGETPFKTIDVEYAGALASSWKVTDVVTNDAPVEVSYKELYRQGDKVGYQVSVGLKKDAPVGALKQEIFLKTTDPASQLVPVLVEATVQALLSISHTRWSVPDAKVGGQYVQTVAVRGEKPFRVLSVEGLGNGIKLANELPTAAAQVHSLKFQLEPAAAGEFKRELLIKTDFQEAPITVTVEAAVQP